MEQTLLILLLCSIIVIIILGVILNKRNKVLEKTVFAKHELEVLRKDEMKKYFKEEWDKEKEKIDYERKVYEGNINNQKAQLENQYQLDASKYEGQIKQLEVYLKEKIEKNIYII